MRAASGNGKRGFFVGRKGNFGLVLGPPQRRVFGPFSMVFQWFSKGHKGRNGNGRNGGRGKEFFAWER